MHRFRRPAWRRVQEEVDRIDSGALQTACSTLLNSTIGLRFVRPTGSDLQPAPKQFSTSQLLELPAVGFDLRMKIALAPPRSDHDCIFEARARSWVLDSCRRC